MRKLFNFLTDLVVSTLPQDAASAWLKRVLLSLLGARIGVRLKIWRLVWIDEPRGLVIGDDVTLGRGVHMLTGGGVSIGDRTMVGHGSQLISSGHRIPASRAESMRFSGKQAAPIVVGDDAWIGAGAIVLGGVSIGRGAVVAAGAVVSRDVPEFAIVAGVPARVVKSRDGD